MNTRLMEIWKDVIGYVGLYKVSNMGRVKSFCRDKNGRILKPGKTSRGYLTVRLYLDGKGKTMAVHRLVAERFLGPAPSPKHEVNHKNGDKTDNRAENLEWVTHSENNKHAYDTLGVEAVRGEAHGNAILTDRKVVEIRNLYATGDHTQIELGRMFGISEGAIGDIVRGKHWKHVGGARTQGGISRHAKGEANGNASLTDRKVVEIRKFYASGRHTQAELAEMFGVAKITIGRIVRREAWKHVP